MTHFDIDGLARIALLFLNGDDLERVLQDRRLYTDYRYDEFNRLKAEGQACVENGDYQKLKTVIRQLDQIAFFLIIKFVFKIVCHVFLLYFIFL